MTTENIIGAVILTLMVVAFAIVDATMDGGRFRR